MEKLKIDMKGWDMLEQIDDLKNPDPDSMQAVIRSAAPFIHNLMSAAYVSSAMVGDMGREVDKELGFGERGETAVEDEIFDIVDHAWQYNPGMFYCPLSCYKMSVLLN